MHPTLFSEPESVRFKIGSEDIQATIPVQPQEKMT